MAAALPYQWVYSSRTLRLGLGRGPSFRDKGADVEGSSRWTGVVARGPRGVLRFSGARTVSGVSPVVWVARTVSGVSTVVWVAHVAPDHCSDDGDRTEGCRKSGIRRWDYCPVRAVRKGRRVVGGVVHRQGRVPSVLSR